MMLAHTFVLIIWLLVSHMSILMQQFVVGWLVTRLSHLKLDILKILMPVLGFMMLVLSNTFFLCLGIFMMYRLDNRMFIRCAMQMELFTYQSWVMVYRDSLVMLWKAKIRSMWQARNVVSHLTFTMVSMTMGMTAKRGVVRNAMHHAVTMRNTFRMISMVSCVLHGLHLDN